MLFRLISVYKHLLSTIYLDQKLFQISTRSLKSLKTCTPRMKGFSLTERNVHGVLSAYNQIGNEKKKPT